MPAEGGGEAVAPTRASSHDLDARGLDWHVDRAVKVLVLLGGTSAVVFILGIFLFITREGLGFVTGAMEVKEFLGRVGFA